MRKYIAIAVGIMVSCVWTRIAAGSQPSLLVSGSQDNAIVDANENGQLGDADDCVLRSFVDADGSNLRIEPLQAITATNRLRACAADYFGSASLPSDQSSDSVEAFINNATLPAGDLPIVFEIVDEQLHPDGLPIRMNDPLDEAVLYDGNTMERKGSGVLCDAGGPAAVVTLDNGVSVLRSLSFFPDAQSPTHLRVPDVPFELLAGGAFVTLDAFVPVTDHSVTVALSSDPDNPVVEIDLGDLPPCVGRTAAPTATESGLLALVLALLVAGTWAIRRRPGFATLPRP